LARFAATVSLEIDHGALRRLCPAILREPPLDDEPLYGAPLPHLAKISINASVIEDFVARKAFLSYLERSVDTPYETVAFVVIEEEERDMSKQLREVMSSLSDGLGVSIGLSRDGVVHAAFARDQLGNAVPTTLQGWGDQRTLARAVEEWLEADGFNIGEDDFYDPIRY
jgi:hypothetical protein